MENGVGNKLHEARTRRSLSLQEAEEATKIRCRYLLAIENEDWDQLPGDTYARAFIRTYAGFLGLDGEQLAEEQRQLRGSVRPGERLPRVDSRPRRVAGRDEECRRLPPRALALAVSALVVVALLVIGLSTGGGSGGTGSGKQAQGREAVSRAKKANEVNPQPTRGHTLQLAAKGEVWVCLLDGTGKPLIDGQILNSGETEGPFRSGSFTIALGNGAMTMTVDGKQANTPEPSSPIGFAIGSGGSVRELPEGKRPTCT